MKRKQLIGRRIRIGGRLHVNQHLQLCKPPKTSKCVHKRPKTHSLVEMAFIKAIMPNFKHDHLYSPSLKCFKQK